MIQKDMMQTQPTATHHGVGSAIHKADYCSRGAVIGMGTQVVHTTSVLSTRSIFALQMTEDSIWTILDVTAVFQIVGRSPDGQNGYQEDCIISVVKAAAHSTFLCMASEVNSVSTRRSPVFGLAADHLVELISFPVSQGTEIIAQKLRQAFATSLDP